MFVSGEAGASNASGMAVAACCVDMVSYLNGCMERVASTVRASTVRPATATFHTTGHTKWPPPVGEGILSNGADPTVCRAAYTSLMRCYELVARCPPATP